MWACAVWKEGGKEKEGAIPLSWIKEDRVYWPPVTDATQAVKECRKPSTKWRSFPLIKIKLKSSSLTVCENFDDTTTNETSGSDDDEVPKRCPKKKKFEGFVTDEIQSRLPPPPLKYKKGQEKSKEASTTQSDNEVTNSPRRSPRKAPQRDVQQNQRRSQERMSHSPQTDQTYRERTSVSPEVVRRSPRKTDEGEQRQPQSLYPMPEARFQKRVISLLVEVRSLLAGGVINSNVSIPGENTAAEEIEPATTEEEFLRMEEALKEPDIYVVCGWWNIFERNVKRMLEKLMTVRLMGKFNMNGQWRANQEKKLAFKKSAFFPVLKASLDKRYQGNDQEFEKVLANIFKYSPDRKGGAGRNTSE